MKGKTDERVLWITLFSVCVTIWLAYQRDVFAAEDALCAQLDPDTASAYSRFWLDSWEFARFEIGSVAETDSLKHPIADLVFLSELPPPRDVADG